MAGTIAPITGGTNPRLRRVVAAVAACVVAIAAGTVAVTVVSPTSTGAPSAAPRQVPGTSTPTPTPLSTTNATNTTRTAPPAGATASPGDTLVATTHGAIPGYPAPGALAADVTVPGSWFGYSSTLPVIATQPGWLEVRLAQRPNGATTWVQQNDVTLGRTPYAIVVNLTTMHLTVYQEGTPIMDFPAGVGAPDEPTPPGQYFVSMTVPPPNATYGAFVLATSAHSNTITDWENSGDAVIGIHGPITAYDDARIGTSGAAISHGCIRLHNADLARLAVIPPGTPLDIVN